MIMCPYYFTYHSCFNDRHNHVLMRLQLVTLVLFCHSWLTGNWYTLVGIFVFRLTLCIRDKTVTILQTIFSNTLYLMKMHEFRLKFPKGPIHSIPALVPIMAWHQPGDKPLSNQWSLDYRRIYASLGFNMSTKYTGLRSIELILINSSWPFKLH